MSPRQEKHGPFADEETERIRAALEAPLEERTKPSLPPQQRDNPAWSIKPAPTRSPRKRRDDWGT